MVVGVDLLDLEAAPLILVQSRLARVSADLGDLRLEVTVEAAEREPAADTRDAGKREVQAEVRLALRGTARVEAGSGRDRAGGRAEGGSASGSGTCNHHGR